MATKDMVDLLAAHIARQWQKQGNRRQLLVCLSGVQGIGKSTIVRALCNRLREPTSRNAHPALRAFAISLDDFYRPHIELSNLAQSQPSVSSSVGLWASRGNPGTHDIHLMMNTLNALKSFKPVEGNELTQILVPQYDKAAFSGAGDRLPKDKWLSITLPIPDVVIFEGWMLGFVPLSSDELTSIYQCTVAHHQQHLKGQSDDLGALHASMICASQCSLQDWHTLNARLADYLPLYDLADTFIHLHHPSINSTEDLQLDWSFVYRWRLQQEHSLACHLQQQQQQEEQALTDREKSHQGVMSDQQVVRFVDRFVPLYVMCGRRLAQRNVFSAVQQHLNPTAQSIEKLHLRVDMDADRQYIGLRAL